MKRVYSNKTQGFTLVELLVVMLVLVALSSITLDFTKDFAFQGRYEVTKDRYDKIKRAIIGRPDVLINGQPDISGFVADMGRLPDNVRELLQMGYCVTSATVPTPPTTSSHFDNARRPNACTGGSLEWRWTNSFCTDEVNTTKATCPSSHLWLGKDTDVTTGLIFGWQGAYLSTSNDPENDGAYSDGWGRKSSDSNYGWVFDSTGTPSLAMQSYGKDQVASGDDYDADYPVGSNILTSNHWQRDLDGINVNIRANYNGVCGDLTCSNPNYTLQATCELNNKTWDAADAKCIVSLYPDQLSCESIPTNTWNSVDARCEDLRFPDQPSCEALNNTWATPVSKFNCDTAGETWTTNSADVCIKVFYKSIDTDGKTLISTTNPLVSLGQSVLEDGQEHLMSFTGLFEDVNNDGDDAGEVNIDIPVGQITLGVYKFAGGICTTARYKNFSVDEYTILYSSPNNLPIVNW